MCRCWPANIVLDMQIITVRQVNILLSFSVWSLAGMKSSSLTSNIRQPQTPKEPKEPNLHRSLNTSHNSLLLLPKFMFHLIRLFCSSYCNKSFLRMSWITCAEEALEKLSELSELQDQRAEWLSDVHRTDPSPSDWLYMDFRAVTALLGTYRVLSTTQITIYPGLSSEIISANRRGLKVEGDGVASVFSITTHWPFPIQFGIRLHCSSSP